MAIEPSLQQGASRSATANIVEGKAELHEKTPGPRGCLQQLFLGVSHIHPPARALTGLWGRLTGLWRSLEIHARHTVQGFRRSPTTLASHAC